MADSSSNLPVFYTRADHTGTKVALWANSRPPNVGERQWSYSGKIGTLDVTLWRAKGPRGIFFQIKLQTPGGLVDIGAAQPYAKSAQGNTLSISLRFASEADLLEARELHGIKEPAKPWRNVLFVNLFPDVSIKAIAADPTLFFDLGFATDERAIRPKTNKSARA